MFIKRSLEGLNPLRACRLVRDGHITLQQFIGNIALSTIGGYMAAEVAQNYLHQQVVSAVAGVLVMGACIRKLEIFGVKYGLAGSESMQPHLDGDGDNFTLERDLEKNELPSPTSSLNEAA